MKTKNSNNNFIELLAPAGSPEKMKYALYYGADAVYCGIPDFSMRYRINKFNEKSLAEAIEYIHKRNKKIYVTMNIYPHNKHFAGIEKHLKFLKKNKPDGIIISDPGIISLTKKYLPETYIHLSTQANAINWQAAKFWFDLGVKRIVLARETTLEEIKEIKKQVPELELEYFVHGAMCMSYSGRCILSKWMTGRSANLGDCAQSCRWSYAPNFQLPIPSARGNFQKNPKTQNSKYKTISMTVEDTKGEYAIDLEEDQNGTYFFNSKDLNLLGYLKELKDAGVESFKIEGRNKSVYYLATAVRAYRKVIDSLGHPMSKYKKAIKEGQKDLNELVHRGYTTGFLLGKEPEHNFQNSHEKSCYKFVGEIMENEKRKTKNEKHRNIIKIKAHNAIYEADKIEIIALEKNIKAKIVSIFDEEMKKVKSAHGGHAKNYFLEIDKTNIQPMSLIRKRLK